MMILLALCLTGMVAAQDANEIELGETVEGLLSTGEPAVEYTFSGEQGQFVSITLIGEPSDGIDSFLQLLDADGTVLIEDDDSAGSLNSRIGPFRIPANGDYTIVATSLGRDDLGAFTLTLESVEIRRIEYGQRVSDELTEAQPEIELAFTAEAGDTIRIDLTSADFDSLLTLYSGSPRQELIRDDDSGGSLNARIGPYVLTEAGEYYIKASSIFGGAVGAFELTLNRVNVLPIAFDEPESASISGTMGLVFAFEGAPDQVVDVAIDSGDLNTTLTLLGPDSVALGTNESTSTGTDPAIQRAILNTFGTHFIVVQPMLSRDAATPVTVTLLESDLPSLEDDAQVMQLNALETQHLVTFMGEAGESVVLRITLAADIALSPDVTVRQGGNQIAAITSFTINDELSFGFEVPADGKVLIELQDYDYVDAEVTIELER
jgi:hypothetical protein